MNEVSVRAIVAMDEGRVIGYQNAIPWHIKEDLQRFSQLTSGHSVLMGRKTFFSLPEKFRPLPKRKNIVVTGQPELFSEYDCLDLDDFVVTDSPTVFIARAKQDLEHLPSSELWVIGGERIYRETLSYCEEIFLTLVYGRHEGDCFFPPFEDSFELFEKEERKTHEFHRYALKTSQVLNKTA